jgi:hypothetical protein
MSTELSASAAKAAPPVAATGSIFLGMSLPDLVMLATLIYTCVISGHAIYKWYWDSKDRRARRCWQKNKMKRRETDNA